MNKRIKIGVTGSNQIQHLIPVLEEKYKVINIQKHIDGKPRYIAALIFIWYVLKIDVLYNVFSDPYFLNKAKISSLLGKKVITHWIGTDVRVAVEGKTNINGYKKLDSNVVCFKALQEDLKELGLQANIIPITPFNLHFDICDMPQEHACLIYMPTGCENYYGFEEISRVFPQFPNLKFYIVANNDKEKFSAYPNVEVLGRLTLKEMEDIYNKISFIIRIHISDGLSMSVLEAMAKGKKIIWNCEYPFAYPGKTTEEICVGVKDILKTKPEPDVAAHDFIASEYTKENFLRDFDKEIKRVLL